MTLDHLHKNRWPISDMLGEDLQQISTLVKVDEDIEFLQDVDVGAQGPGDVGETPAEVRVVCTGDFEELNAPGLEVCDGGDDVVGAEGDVLDAGAVIVVDESGFAVRILDNIAIWNEGNWRLRRERPYSSI
jgi:hypothetical protein